MVEVSIGMKKYFEIIQNQVNQCYDIAERARKKGRDPEMEVESPQARDLAGRVEKLVGPEGVAEIIREAKKQGKSDDEIVFQVVSDILDRKIGNIDSIELRVERAIRVGLAIKTMGVVSAPLEGISKILIKQDQQGNKYLSLYFAGPIRAAGGTTAALCVLIADFVRRKSKIPEYRATDGEIGRYVEEVKLYDRRVHLQYPSSNDEIRFAVEHLPVEINGDSTEDEEVSAFRDLPRIETNKIRGGACLVLNDGVILKAPKLLKIANQMNLDGWDWLADLKKIANKEEKKENENRDSEEEKMAPNYKYVADIIAGRPVFSHPSEIGGHRIRYGRARNTGLAAGGLHPATMAILDDFVAIGTQLRIERPGKSSSICPVSSIEPPIVKLKGGDVIRVKSPKLARDINPKIEQILFLGDILFGFGEFAENNHKLVPSGYVEEWWALELEKAVQNRDEDVNKFYMNPFENIPTAEEMIKICKKYNIPLHPCYLNFWGNLTIEELISLRECLLKGFGESKDRIILENEENIKNILEKAFILHKIENGKILLSKKMTQVYETIFDLHNKNTFKKSETDTVFTYFDKISPIKIKNKAPYYMGTRMGRPEKSERKSMKGIHSLFPLSDKVGNSRLVEKAMELEEKKEEKEKIKDANITDAEKKKFRINIDVCRRECPSCGGTTIFNLCPKCKVHTELRSICENCKKLFPSIDPKDEMRCPQCGERLKSSSEATFNIKSYIKSTLKSLQLPFPPKLKGIIGLTNQFKIPEPIEKGILRAKNDVLVYKTAEIRYDATDIPLTHFKPSEIGTTIEHLKELGYKNDYKGNPIHDNDQIIELKVQDLLLSYDCADYMQKVANFLDDELEIFYKMERFYNIKNRQDLVGHMVVGLAPHTSAGIIGRIIGFSPARSIYAHPFWHAAKRRNCLARTEELIIWDDCKKELIITQIGDIIENLIKSGARSKKVDKFGTIILENLYPEWYAISIDPFTKEILYQPIKHWIKGNSDQWITITTQTGRTITMTEDHLAMIWNSETNTYERIKAKYLKIGNSFTFLSKLNLPICTPPSNINILKQLSINLPKIEKFKQFKQQVRLRGAADWIRSKLMTYARNNLSLNICKPYQRVQPQIRKYFIDLLPSKPHKNPLTIKWYNSIPLNHLEILQEEGVFKWNEIPHNTQLGMARDDHIINPYIPFNTDLMRLLGYYISEGYIRDESSCYQINFSVPNPILRKHVKKLIIDILGSEPYFNKDNGQLIHTGRIHAYLFAYAWKLGRGAYNKAIPNFIYTLPERFRLELLSAFIDGDGSIPKTDNTLILYSVSKKLLHHFGILLSTLGVMYRPRKPTPEGHYGKIILDRYKQLGKKPKKSIVHRIAIRGSDLFILKKLNLKNLNKRRNAQRILKSGFYSELKVKSINGTPHILKKEKNLILDPIDKIEIINKSDLAYCFEVDCIKKEAIYHNFSTSMCITSNCDGDEDGIMLLLDPLLNFSRNYLPSKIGGRMDATLVISTKLDPNEIDVEAHNIDTSFKYPLEFYEATEQYTSPNEIESIMNLVKSHLGTSEQYENFGFNIPTEDVNDGPTITSYKTYESMDDKLNAQLRLAKIIKAVNAKKVASQILITHFNPDILGNLRKFATQEFRCVKCNTKFRRPPLSKEGKCPLCGNNIILTVNRGGIEKYISRALMLCKEFNLDNYTVQRMELVEEYVESLTNNPKIKQQKLTDFF